MLFHGELGEYKYFLDGLNGWLGAISDHAKSIIV